MNKILKTYQKDLSRVKKIEETLKNELKTVGDIQSKTAEFQKTFEPIHEEKNQALKELTDNPDFSLDEINERRQKIIERYHSERKQKIAEIRDEAFATHRRACEIIFGQTFELDNGDSYKWEMIPYDVQIVGAMGLNDGNIAEMKTGEGKTLVATLAAYLNALSGEPVHIVTVNEYLASRDASEMGVIYGTLGLTTGVILNAQNTEEKKENYARNILYTTNNELGFDYLRDNMSPTLEDQVQGELAYAIVDEVDSILIDEARTPLIISAPDNEATTKYMTFKELAKKLQEGRDYKTDEKVKTSTLTEKGIEEVERMLGVDNIFVSEHYRDLHHVENALKAQACYIRDLDYIVRNDQVMIIDEHTGRVMDGRRFSHGLHQALEAKEGVDIQKESKTLASITFQNYFRLYEKLAGMTGTAKTEEEEFQKIYGLDVIVVPTNKPIIRDDKADLLFKNEEGKMEYLVNEIEKIHKTGQPVLVGTVSVAKSEYISSMMSNRGIKHEVLNAKQDEREADIVAQAGQKGAVTIATNMAGRGTDIKLGEGVVDLGGLYIVGTEKHETRRIDNQLRGRSGRQGDPGSTQFMVSPGDDIMRIFGGDKLFAVFNSPMFASLPANEPLTQSKFLTRRITTVQKQVEGRNFDIRKHILEYDDVLDQHRKVIYSRRKKILESFDDEQTENAEIDKQINRMLEAEAAKIVGAHKDEDGELEYTKIAELASGYLGAEGSIKVGSDQSEHDVREGILSQFRKKVDDLKEAFKDRNFDRFQRRIYLSSIDQLWMDHIDRMSNLREEVAFAGYANKNPLLVYKEQAYDIFMELLDAIEHKVIRGLLGANPETQVQQRNVDLAEIKRFVDQQKKEGTDPNMIANVLRSMGVQVTKSGQESGAINPAAQTQPQQPQPRRSADGFKKEGQNNKKKHVRKKRVKPAQMKKKKR